jgi:hypothetical protein
MKYGIFIVAFVALTAGAQTYPTNPFTNEAAGLQAQLNACVACTVPNQITAAPATGGARVVTQVLTPQGNYVIIPNYATGATAAILQVSRTARGK